MELRRSSRTSTTQAAPAVNPPSRSANKGKSLVEDALDKLTNDKNQQKVDGNNSIKKKQESGVPLRKQPARVSKTGSIQFPTKKGTPTTHSHSQEDVSAVALAVAPSSKPAIKGKRVAEDALEKQSNTKKQKIDGRKASKKKQNTNISDDSSSDKDAEFEALVPPKKLPAVTASKNKKKTQPSESFDSNGNSSNVEEATLSEVGVNSTRIVAGSSSVQPQTVEVNEFGVPVSANSTKISSRIGSLVRTHVPIFFRSWKKVPSKHKDDIWNDLLVEYDLPAVSKPGIIKQMSGPFRRRKADLRQKYYYPLPTEEERKRNVPPNIMEEDWVKFCENEARKEAVKMREQNKKNRSCYSSGHTTGRMRHAKLESDMRKEDPTIEITRTDVWIKARVRKDGSVLASAAPYVEKIMKVIETQPESNKASLSLDTDPLSQVFGKDSRGFVRGVGGLVSKAQIKASAPARAKFTSIQSEAEELRKRVAWLENALHRRGHMDELLEETRGKQPAHDTASNIVTCGTPQLECADNTRCILMNLAEEFIAYGRVCKDQSARTIHGCPVQAKDEKVLLEKILMPDEKLSKANHRFASTFREVGVGGFVVHPKFVIRYL